MYETKRFLDNYIICSSLIQYLTRSYQVFGKEEDASLNNNWTSLCHYGTYVEDPAPMLKLMYLVFMLIGVFFDFRCLQDLQLNL